MKMKIGVLMAIAMCGPAFAQPDPANDPVQGLARAAFTAARMCHAHSVLYGQILQARKEGAEKGTVEKKLNMASSPMVVPLINSAYDGPLEKTMDPEEFYADCATKMQALVVKTTPALKAK